jgi:xylulokinase
LLCINGTGILNSWLRRNVATGMSYVDMNDAAAGVEAGSGGVTVIPFGNGAERILENRNPGCQVGGLDFNRHSRAHLLRAAQEGIAFSFRYGMDIMRSMGMEIRTIRAGHANMFLSPVFRETLATITGARIELFDTDGALGAARGAAVGAGAFRSFEEAFASLHRLDEVAPNPAVHPPLTEAYEGWRRAVGETR